jgi:hypothetical protein
LIIFSTTPQTREKPMQAIQQSQEPEAPRQSLLIRGQSEPYANLRLFNARSMARAAAAAGDQVALDEFKIDGVRLVEFLDA